jgi:hypothetical protein
VPEVAVAGVVGLSALSAGKDTHTLGLHSLLLAPEKEKKQFKMKDGIVL